MKKNCLNRADFVFGERVKDYPNHDRVPNLIVRGLYVLGYFVDDFVPMILNFFDGVYRASKRLIAFFVGLLVESSIFVVVISSIVFSVEHSIELMRKVGAVNGLEYVGVGMFEVIYLGSSATLTDFLMKKRKPVGVEWMLLCFTLLGFLIGLGFVWWSNVSGLIDTTEGRIVGSLVPVLVLIGEGILAFRYLSDRHWSELQHNTTENASNNSANQRTNTHNNSGRRNSNINANDDNNVFNDNHHGHSIINTTNNKYSDSSDNGANYKHNNTNKSDNDNAHECALQRQQQYSKNDDNDDSNNNDNKVYDNQRTNTHDNNRRCNNNINANGGTNNHHNNTNNHKDTVTTNKVVNMDEKRKKRKELDPDTVIKIFLSEGSNAHIGRKFGVSAETVRKIKLGERHADVTAPYRQAK